MNRILLIAWLPGVSLPRRCCRSRWQPDSSRVCQWRQCFHSRCNPSAVVKTKWRHRPPRRIHTPTFKQQGVMPLNFDFVLLRFAATPCAQLQCFLRLLRTSTSLPRSHRDARDAVERRDELLTQPPATRVREKTVPTGRRRPRGLRVEQRPRASSRTTARLPARKNAGLDHRAPLRMARSRLQHRRSILQMKSQCSASSKCSSTSFIEIRLPAGRFLPDTA